VNYSVIHLAITYIDIILSTIEIPHSEYKLLAIGCLSIASKFDEDDPNLPLAHEFIKFSSLKISRKDFIKSESKILQKYLQWDLNVTTVFHFSECLLSMGIIFENDSMKGNPVTEKQYKYMRKRVMFFVDLSIEWDDLKKNKSLNNYGCLSLSSRENNKRELENMSIKFTPSIIAVTCIIW